MPYVYGLEEGVKAATDLDAVFQALSDSTRRDILEMLRGGERSTGDLAEAFPVTRPAVSRHLRVLCEAGLASRRKEGRRQLYRVTARPLLDAHGWLGDQARHWRASLHSLKAFVEGEGEEAAGSEPRGDARG